MLEYNFFFIFQTEYELKYRAFIHSNFTQFQSAFDLVFPSFGFFFLFGFWWIIFWCLKCNHELHTKHLMAFHGSEYRALLILKYFFCPFLTLLFFFSFSFRFISDPFNLVFLFPFLCSNFLLIAHIKICFAFNNKLIIVAFIHDEQIRELSLSKANENNFRRIWDRKSFVQSESACLTERERETHAKYRIQTEPALA